MRPLGSHLLAGLCVWVVLGWAGGSVTNLGPAEQEQNHYLAQLFGLYGENGTLTAGGLARLLHSLGLGRVQALRLGHHGPPTGRAAPPARDNSTHRLQGPELSVDVWAGMPLSPSGWGDLEESKAPYLPRGPAPSGLGLFHRLLLLDHSLADHLNEDCLNGSQLLVNFGLSPAAPLTPRQFALLCPALLYQIESRVCIQAPAPVPSGDLLSGTRRAALRTWRAARGRPGSRAVGARRPLPALCAGEHAGALAAPKAQATNREQGRLSRAPGLLAKWLPLKSTKSRGRCQSGKRVEAKEQPQVPEVEPGAHLPSWLPSIPLAPSSTASSTRRDPPLFQKCCTMRKRRELGTSNLDPEDGSGMALQPLRAAPEPGAQGQREQDSQPPPAPALPGHHGHSHGHQGDTSITWMVLLGDGLHNLTDGLAIGAAFSDGFSSGLSTTLAVFCHELPHELGDFAVLLQAGLPFRRLLLLSLVSGALGLGGAALGVGLSLGPVPLTPWVFGLTAGVFLYVALVDMLPALLRPPEPLPRLDRLLQGLGLLLGGSLMLTIALLEDQLLPLVSDG